ncbi:hypothetical protein KC19_6G187000 [Ceratodon purpureus]|uniref:Uncharacterized protein n=1 Tax=Ceratodon purpureus TaxID=3225 RepID=A0A8T0HHP3_CERPU|nr:hypothetical protein KC19_6G187000 [Ceratodon purpureus]
MGAGCSRRRNWKKPSSINDTAPHHQPWPPSLNNVQSSSMVPDPVVTPPKQSEAMAKGMQETHKTSLEDVFESSPKEAFGDDSITDEKRRLSRILSSRVSTMRNKTSTVAKKGASRVLGKAVEAFDTLGSSVANRGTAFGTGAVLSRRNKIGILSFEVANTIVKGCNLKESLTEEEMKVLEEETLNSPGVQLLVSTDHKELMSIAAADKRHELKVFADEVVRFGNHCRDPQWHQLDRVFDRLVREDSILHQSEEEAHRIMDDLMIVAQNTAELYHELLALDRFQIDLKRKQQEEEFFAGAAGRGAAVPEETVALLKGEVKSQERHVKTLKRRSLWGKTLEEVMEQLVDVVYYLYQEINDKFGPDVFMGEPENGCRRKNGKLGTSGLALHYANIINQIDNLATRPSSVPSNARDNLYQGLPPTMKSALRVRLQQKPRKDGLTMDELKSELYKTLDWLVPVASNTTKAHHGFGWVGEWANTGSSIDRKSMGHTELTLLQTLHHANQQKVESYILELIVGLHFLVTRARENKNKNSQPSPQKFPIKTTPVRVRKTTPSFVPPERNISPPPFQMFANSANYSSGWLTPKVPEEEAKVLANNGDNGPVFTRRTTTGLSKSQEIFDYTPDREHARLNKSSSHNSPSTAKKLEFEQPVYKPRLKSKVDSSLKHQIGV